MSDDVFIAVVPSPGSYEPTWHGAFRFDKANGYEGKFISTKSDLKPGPITFEAPTELDRETLFCNIDGSSPATAVWPQISLRTINFMGPGSRIVDAQLPVLIKGVHVGAEVCCIKSMILLSPLFAALFGIQGFRATMIPASHAFHIETRPDENIKFTTKLWSITIGTASSIGRPDHKLAPNIDLTGCAILEFDTNISPVQALKLASQIEYFLSLVCLGFVSCERLHCIFETPTSGGDLVEMPSSSGQTDKTRLEVIRAKRVAQTEVDLLKLPIRLQQVDFGIALERFVEIFDSLEQSLGWYRIVMAEERSLEGKYSHAVRMIEALYKVLRIDGQPDKGLLKVVDRVCDKLPNDDDKCSLVTFINERVRPIFSRPWSLADVIKDLRTRYSDLKIIEALDERIVNKIRGKETHGSAKRLSARERKFMLYSYDLIAILYALVILEHCGIDRGLLLSELQRPSSHALFFSSDYVERVQKELAI